MKIMTFNIQHGLDYNRVLSENAHIIDLKAVADTIRAQGADLCGLNEVNGAGADEVYTAQAQTIAGHLGWNYYFAEAIRFKGTNPYGNALVTRWPILKAETIGIPDPEVKDEDAYYETRCILKALVDADGTPLTVLVVHIGLAKAEARNAVATLLSVLSEITGPVVLMGDFNLQPDDPILAPLLAVMDDTADKLTGCRLSFPSNKSEIKIDYILSREMTCETAEIPQIVVSDHCPYTAVFEG